MLVKVVPKVINGRSVTEVGVLDHPQVTQRVQGPVARGPVDPRMAGLHPIRQVFDAQMSIGLSQLLQEHSTGSRQTLSPPPQLVQHRCQLGIGHRREA